MVLQRLDAPEGAWLTAEDVAEPQPPPGQVAIDVEACGICGTDARTFFNGDPKATPPWQLGHEPVGVLEEVGGKADLPA